MKIIRKTTIKQILTPDSKANMKNRFLERKKQLEQEVKQLQFEKKKIEKKLNYSKEEVSKRFQIELDQRKEQIRWLDYQLSQLEILPLGSEITEGETESIVEVNIGDSWETLMKDSCIVVKDGIVDRIDG
ncbi:YlqD family protein [Bacillaceae bacterium S4-13-58]